MVEVLTHLRETTARHSSLADKTIQKQKKTKIESGASYNRNRSARGMRHSRAAHCLSQTTISATFHWGVHIQMFITLQLQPEHLDKNERMLAGSANTSFQHTAARQSCPSTLGGRPSSLPAAEQFGCLFSARQTVKSLSESRTQTDMYMLQQTSWMANVPINSAGLLLSTCVNWNQVRSVTSFQLPSQDMTSPVGSR